MSEETALKTKDQTDGAPVGLVEKEEVKPKTAEAQAPVQGIAENPAGPETEINEAPSETSPPESTQVKTTAQEIKPEAEVESETPGPASKKTMVSRELKDDAKEPQAANEVPAEVQTPEPEIEQTAVETASPEQAEHVEPAEQEIVSQQPSVETPTEEEATQTPSIDTPEPEAVTETPITGTESVSDLSELLYSEFLPDSDPSRKQTDEKGTGRDTVIKVIDLVKDYSVGWLQNKKFRCLNGVSLEVKAGEIFGFLGPNGAGKTTTIKTLLGITKPTSGSIEIFGSKGSSRSARAHIGYFPEISYYHKYLSAKEAVKYYGKLCGVSGKELKMRTHWVLEMVGLFEHRNKLLKKFSKGMLQRLGLAQALINDPALLIMDEPTSGLDPLMKKEMRSLIQNLNLQGKTIFFSSHELSEVEMICHRVAILDKGKIIDQGSLSDVLPSEAGLTIVARAVSEKVQKELLAHGVEVSQENGDFVIHCCDNNKVYFILAKLGANDCELVEVRPQKQTLEDYYVNTIREKQGGVE